ncbi:MAG: hypothetical protein WCO09_01635, partial [bacterium]
PGPYDTAVIDSNTVTLTATRTSASTAVSAAGILNLAGFNFTSPIFTSSGTLQLQGGETLTTPTMSAGATVEYTATGSIRDIKNWDYTNATLKISGTGETFTLPTNITVAGINITAGILDSNGFNITNSSNWANSVGVSGFNARAGTVTFNGSGAAVTGATNFYRTSGTGTIIAFPSLSTILENNTSITTNNGIIAINNSAIGTNGTTGIINTNNSTTTTNNGTISTNSSSGTIGTNNLTVTNNNGIVTTNNGTVTNNNSTVSTNAFGGSVVNNLGSININNGTADTAVFHDRQYNGATGIIAGDATFDYSGFVATDGAVIDMTGYANGGIVGLSKDSLGNTINTWVFNSTNNLGKVTGNAMFNGTTTNFGTVTGNVIFNNSSSNSGTIMHNVDIYSPVPRPLGGTVYGLKTYHGYDGMYFNDTATGHGTTGKWNDPLNWWTDSSFTIHAGDFAGAGDEVHIYSDISTTTATATAASITFEGGAKNYIGINISGNATFNSSSANAVDGSITASSTTFIGNLTDDLGSVIGNLTRLFTVSTTTTRNFTTEGGRNDWVVVAQGVAVNISNAIYNTATNIFKALSGGTFTSNSNINGGASVAPVLVSTLPTNGQAVTKWLPIISWGDSTLCEYSYNNWASTTVANCAGGGADILRPATTTNTLSLRGTRAGNISEQNISFTYNNAVAIPTSCGSDLLDEATRPYYYLAGNVTGDCIVSVNTEIHGASSSGMPGFTLTGNVLAGSHNISLSNITVDGIASSTGNVTVVSSTVTGAVDAVGTWNLDANSYFTSATVRSGGSIQGGNFSGNLVNNGTIITNVVPTIVLGNTTNNGSITGSFIFNASSTSSGTVSGDAVLNASSTNTGAVGGNLTFNTLTATNGEVTFAGGTAFSGTGYVTGLIKDSLGATITGWRFTGSSTNSGFTKGIGSFLNTSSNNGIISGNSYFSDSSANTGTVTGTADIYYPHIMPMSGNVIGGKIYHSYPNGMVFGNSSGDGLWSNASNWFTDTTLTTHSNRIPSIGEDVVLLATTTLSNDVTGDIYVATSGITIFGGDHKLTGNISGNGAYGGYKAYDFNLGNITVTGTTSASGGEGNSTSAGGRGGTINIDTSSTGGVVVNGGDPDHDGGDAGTSTITNSFALVDGTRILAVGGASNGCGYGGNGGNISLFDSSGYILVTATGADATSTCDVIPPAPTSRSGGYTTQVGIYISPASRAAVAAAATAQNSNTNRGTGSTGSGTSVFQNLNTNIGILNLANLPKIGLGDIGNNLGVSNFVNPLANIINLKPTKFPDLPKVDWVEKIQNFLSNSLPNLPITVLINGEEKETKLLIDSKGKVYQSIVVDSSVELGIKVKNPNSKGIAAVSFNGKNIKVTKDKKNEIKFKITAPKDDGSYILKVGVLTLEVKVVTKVNNPSTKQNASIQGNSKKVQIIQKLPLWRRIWNKITGK